MMSKMPALSHESAPVVGIGKRGGAATLDAVAPPSLFERFQALTNRPLVGLPLDEAWQHLSDERADARQLIDSYREALNAIVDATRKHHPASTHGRLGQIAKDALDAG